MIVGVLVVELAIFEAQSLKDKRRAILSIKQRLRNRFNVSVAEVGYGDSAKRCQLGLAVVSLDSRTAHSQLDQVVDAIRSAGSVTVLNYERQLY